MKINKLKALSVAICCAFTALWTEIQGAENIQDVNRFQVAVHQESEGQHNLANFNYNLALGGKEGNEQNVIPLQVQIQIQNQYVKGTFYNINYKDWSPCKEASWNPMTFNQFSGDECLRGNLSIVEIPEDGAYSLHAQYHWKATSVATAPYTGIVVERLGNKSYYFTQHHLAPHFTDLNYLNSVQRLKRGDKVMLSVHGHENAEYYLNSFKFIVEKII